MPRRILTSLMMAAILVPAVANAQSQKDMCKILAEPMLSASNAMQTLRDSVHALNVQQVLPKLTGDFRKELSEFDQARTDLLPVLEVFLKELEDAALSARSCAR